MKQQYKEYLRLNKNILLGFLASIVISAVVAQLFSNQQSYVNATISLGVDYVVYFSTFGSLYYIDNKKKYLLETGQVDKAVLRRDLIKVISSLGIGEVIDRKSTRLNSSHVEISYAVFCLKKKKKKKKK